MVDALVRSETDQLLQQIFPELDYEDIAALSRAAMPCVYPAGVDVCREGELGDTLYIIASGEADVVVHAANQQEIMIDTIATNAYFGEMAMLGETTRSATIRTRVVCHMLEISHHAFLAITDSNPGLLRRLLGQVIGHLRRNDRAVIQALNVKNSELQRTYADLAEQEQLRSQFIATLSHELRTPLTSIRGYLGLINKGALHGDSLQVAMGSITRNVESMVVLTNQMMLLHEMFPKSPDLTLVELPDLIVEALRITREVVEDQETAVKLNFSPALPPTFADKGTLILAIRAILENAFKYNPNKTKISVRVYCPEEGVVAIAIQDEGIGIPPCAHSRIFDPFYRLETEGGTHLFPGIGAGLTIANMVIARHNGRIELSSQLGVGSTFTIFLPAQYVKAKKNFELDRM